MDRAGVNGLTFTEEEAQFIQNERVMRFNSLLESGEIHSVPVCFAFDGKSFFVHARRSNAKRWKNVRSNNLVSLELDNYSDDWSRLKGLLVHGKARFLESGPSHDRALSLLRRKYAPYSAPRGGLELSVLVVEIVPYRVTSWFLGRGTIPNYRSY